MSHSIRTTFDKYCGDNILLSNDRTEATRTREYGDGLVYKETPLRPGEFFVVEVMESENSWSGHLRLGITLTGPSGFSNVHSSLPKVALPDLATMCTSWIFSASPNMPWKLAVDSYDPDYSVLPDSIAVTENMIYTCFGMYSKSSFRGTEVPNAPDLIVGGSRIGIVFLPVNEFLADLFGICNGRLYGPLALGVPYEANTVFAIIDVYGKTKKVKIVQLHPIIPLKMMCQDVIRHYFPADQIEKMQLPPVLKQSCLSLIPTAAAFNQD